MSNIYNIQQNLLSIFEQIEENEGELTPELELALQINQANFKNKVRDYTKVIQQFETDIKAIKEEKDRLNSLQKSKENTINSLKQILIVAIKNFGDTNKSGVKYVDWGTGKCSIRKSTSIDIDTDRVNTFIHKVISYFDWLKYTNTEGQQEINIDDIVDYANKGSLDSDTKFTKDDLIGLKPYAVRDLNYIKSELKLYGKPVKIYRIGDTQTDKLSIPKELNGIVNKKDIYKYCTKPELEILLIINEGLLKDYEKVKSIESPKTFAKKNIKFNGKKYDQSSDFLKNYYSDINKLIKNLKEYKKYKKKHNKDELYLADLLK